MKTLKRTLLAFLLTALVGTFALAQEEEVEEAAEEATEQVEETAEKAKDKMAEKDIVETAMAADNLSTLVAAVKAAGLVETLQGEGPFTVFAPTNEAFEALPEGKLDELLKPENKEKLTSILTYHVVPGKVMSTDLAEMEEIGTANGANLSLGDASVVSADIAASNGVIHVIDTVLVPEMEEDGQSDGQ